MAEDQVIAAANVVLRKVSGHDGGPLLHSGKGDGLLDQSLHGRQVEKDARTLRGILYDGEPQAAGPAAEVQNPPD